MRIARWCATIFVVLFVPAFGEDGRSELLVHAVSYRVIPHETTAYYTKPGRSNTTCYGSGADWGYWTTLKVDCDTVTTPPSVIPVTMRSIEVYNLVEASGSLYTIECHAANLGSGCIWLIPGEDYKSDIKGPTMWVAARRWGNAGNEVRVKFRVLDVAHGNAAAASSSALPPPSNDHVTGSYAGIVHNTTVGESAHFGIAIREEGGTIFGCLAIKRPLYGSGALQGTVQGSQVSFDSKSLMFSISFQGEWHDGELTGSYVVNSPNRQNGVFELQRRSTDAPQSGFDLKDCRKRLAAF